MERILEELNDAQERLINYMSMFFCSHFNRKNIGAWFLDGDTLIEFIINRRISMRKAIEVGLLGVTEKQLMEVSEKMRNPIKKLSEDTYELIVYYAPDYNVPKVHVKLYKNLPNVEGENIIQCPTSKIDILRGKEGAMSQWGTWNYNIHELYKYTLPVPYRVGAFLDITRPGWFKTLKHDPRPKGPEIFFNPVRTKNAVHLMRLLHEAAEKSGFREYIFPGFGTLLGIIREGDFIQSDRDMDHCIMGPKITKLNEERFLVEVAKERENVTAWITETDTIKLHLLKGLYEGRERKPKRRTDNGRFLWTSCGHLRPSSQQGCKSCVWKWFEHDGYAWHSKGGKWVNGRKFNEDEFNYDPNSIQAIAKGIRAEYVSEFTQIQFKGIEINVPIKAGHCLDAWYPGWARPASGASRKINVLIIPDWSKPKGWHQA